MSDVRATILPYSGMAWAKVFTGVQIGLICEERECAGHSIRIGHGLQIGIVIELLAAFCDRHKVHGMKQENTCTVY